MDGGRGGRLPRVGTRGTPDPRDMDGGRGGRLPRVGPRGTPDPRDMDGGTGGRWPHGYTVQSELYGLYTVAQ